MQQSARDGDADARPRGLRPAGRPCPRCGDARSAQRGQWDDNRPTFWCPGCQRVRRVGHKGADLIAPGNTPAAFDAALAAGVDMIEFDVLPERRSTAPASCTSPTTTTDLRAGSALTLEEGLAHLAGDAYAGVELDVDLKLPGYEERVLDALRRARPARARRSSARPMRSSLARPARRRAAACGSGWSVPKLRKDPTPHRGRSTAALGAALPAPAAAPALRGAGASARGEMDARDGRTGGSYRRACVRGGAAAGGEVYVWTVDDAAHDRAASRRSGSTASSRTTRGCSRRDDADAARPVARIGARRRAVTRLR